MTTPSDHPPAIPPIGVRSTVRWYDMWNCPYRCAPDTPTCVCNFARNAPTPLGLSPEQPARCGGTES